MKRLTPKDDRVTIVVPKIILDEIKRKTKGPNELNSWVLFALIKSLKDDNFSWDLRQSEEYFDQPIDF